MIEKKTGVLLIKFPRYHMVTWQLYSKTPCKSEIKSSDQTTDTAQSGENLKQIE